LSLSSHRCDYKFIQEELSWQEAAHQQYELSESITSGRTSVMPPILLRIWLLVTWILCPISSNRRFF